MPAGVADHHTLDHRSPRAVVAHVEMEAVAPLDRGRDRAVGVVEGELPRPHVADRHRLERLAPGGADEDVPAPLGEALDADVAGEVGHLGGQEAAAGGVGPGVERRVGEPGRPVEGQGAALDLPDRRRVEGGEVLLDGRAERRGQRDLVPGPPARRVGREGDPGGAGLDRAGDPGPGQLGRAGQVEGAAADHQRPMSLSTTSMVPPTTFDSLAPVSTVGGRPPPRPAASPASP